MKKLNDRNWQYINIYFGLNKYTKKCEKHEPVFFPDFECIRMRTMVLVICKYLKKTPKLTILEGLRVKVNLYSMVVVSPTGQVKLLKEQPFNGRFSRYRPDTSKKYDALLLHSHQEKRDFA